MVARLKCGALFRSEGSKMAATRKIIYSYIHDFFIDGMPILLKMLIKMIIQVIHIQIAYTQSLFYLYIKSKMDAA